MQLHSSGMEFLKPEQQEAEREQLYRLHAPVILAYLRLHLSSEEEAEDLLLDVFLAALQSKDLLTRTEDSQQAWLLTVARHKVIDRYRQKGRQQFVALEQVIDNLYEDDAFSPEQVTLQREAYDQIRAMLKQLPSSQQQTVWLKFVYGLRCSEIAIVLGKRESTVRTWLSRALQFLRANHSMPQKEVE